MALNVLEGGKEFIPRPEPEPRGKGGSWEGWVGQVSNEKQSSQGATVFGGETDLAKTGDVISRGGLRAHPQTGAKHAEGTQGHRQEKAGGGFSVRKKKTDRGRSGAINGKETVRGRTKKGGKNPRKKPIIHRGGE